MRGGTAIGRPLRIRSPLWAMLQAMARRSRRGNLRCSKLGGPVRIAVLSTRYPCGSMASHEPVNDDTKAQGSGPPRDPASDPDIISLQIQLAREEAGLSVVEVSRLTGISKTVLHGYERGRTKPGAREIRLLSAALKISPNRLILGSDTFEGGRPAFTSVYRKIRARPELGSVFLTMFSALVTPVFDEAELEALLVLLHALVKSRSPALARSMLIAADELGAFLDSHSLPDGSLTFDLAALGPVIEAIQARVEARVAEAEADWTKQAI